MLKIFKPIFAFRKGESFGLTAGETCSPKATVVTEILLSNDTGTDKLFSIVVPKMLLLKALKYEYDPVNKLLKRPELLKGKFSEPVTEAPVEAA